jgi:hypothetical protein
MSDFVYDPYGNRYNSVAKQHAIVANSVAEQRERVAQDVLVPRMSEGQANLVANQRGSVAKSVATQRLISQAEELREQGLSWVEIARRWNAEGIPTLTGKGQWHDANIARLVKSAAR